jgi:predicted PurR-regulated permease PerM
MESQTVPLPGDARWRRLVVVALFLGLIYFFRNLAPVFICFIVFERSLGWAAEELDRRTRLERKGAIAAILTGIALLFGAGVLMVVRRTLPLVHQLRAHGADYLRGIFEHPSVEKLKELAGLEDEQITHAIKDHAGTALHYATGTAHLIIYVLIGFLLAVIYLFEREQLRGWLTQITQQSLQGTLLRWFGYVGDAIAVTVKMQAVVALVSAVVTLPVLIALRLPHIPLLFLLLLVSGLVPVVGNLISGAVLCYVAYTARGGWAVGVFLGVTFVLHKIESYYLNPRLAAQHVQLPGLVLVIALLLFEQAFGFIGLFLSFPALYVATRIGNEWRLPQAPQASPASAVPAMSDLEAAPDEEAPDQDETPPTQAA